MWKNPVPMRVSRLFWLVTTITAVSALVMTLAPPFVPAPSRPRFDEPGAAARHDLERRRPSDARLDMPRLYETATSRIASLARFSSAINRDLPAALPAARVWVSGSLVVPMKEFGSAAGILDAWTPLGP